MRCQKRMTLTERNTLVGFRIQESTFGFLKTSILFVKEKKGKDREGRRVIKSTGIHKCLGVSCSHKNGKVV